MQAPMQDADTFAFARCVGRLHICFEAESGKQNKTERPEKNRVDIYEIYTRKKHFKSLYCHPYGIQAGAISWGIREIGGLALSATVAEARQRQTKLNVI